MAELTGDVVDDLSAGDAFAPGYQIVVSDVAGLSDALSHLYGAAVEIADALGLDEAMAARAAYALTALDALDLSASFAPGWRIVVLDDMSLADVADAVAGLTMRDDLALSDAFAPGVTWLVAHQDGVALTDVASHGLAAIVSEALALTDETRASAAFKLAAADALALGDVTTMRLTALAVVADGLTLTEDQVLRMIFHGDLRDDMRLVVGVRDPGSVTRWAVNTRTGFVTEYRGRSFDSYGLLGRRQIGMSRDGLWALEGDTDDGAPIASRLRGGVLELNGSRLTSLRGVYLGMHVVDETLEHLLKVVTGDDKVYVYRFRPRDMETVRVIPARGLRARYFQWELELVGTDFALDAIEFAPMRTTRRGGR